MLLRLYPDGKTHFFRSRMAYLAEHELIESIGYGFGIRLQVQVENGDLVYRSNGHVWQGFGIRLIIPDCLLLGTATISEHAVADDRFFWSLAPAIHGGARRIVIGGVWL